MGALGIVFADGKFNQLGDLVKVRTEASLPFGGRYRLIDFTLSNMVNSDITNVAIITQKNYQSLMDHIGSGKEWDLSRKYGGVVIFPPYSGYRSSGIFNNSIDALHDILGYIKKINEEDVILTTCDSVDILDYSKVLRKHNKNNADITIVYRNVDNEEVKNNDLVLDINESFEVTNAQFGVKKDVNNVAIGTFVIKKDLLINILEIAISKGATSFEQEFIVGNIGKLKMVGFVHDGTYLLIDSLNSYYQTNMSLLDEDVRSEVLLSTPLYTKVKDSAPTKYGIDCKVKNSFIADGCIIDGIVENSILFRGVKISKGTKVKNCILMQDTVVLENVELNSVITDKNVKISAHQKLSGSAKLPYYIGKGMDI